MKCLHFEKKKEESQYLCFLAAVYTGVHCISGPPSSAGT